MCKAIKRRNNRKQGRYIRKGNCREHCSDTLALAFVCSLYLYSDRLLGLHAAVDSAVADGAVAVIPGAGAAAAAAACCCNSHSCVKKSRSSLFFVGLKLLISFRKTYCLQSSLWRHANEGKMKKAT